MSQRRVLFLTLYGELGASSRIRVYQFLEGIDLEEILPTIRILFSDYFYRVQLNLQKPFVWKPLYTYLYLGFATIRRFFHLLDAWKFDAVFIQKDTLPKWQFRLLKKLNDKIIYEFDDNIDEACPYESSSWFKKYLFKYRSELFRYSVKNSKTIVTDNTYLEKIARRYNPHTIIISAPIDTSQIIPYREKTGTELPPSPFVIGWMGSPMTDYLLYPLLPLIQEFKKTHPTIRFFFVGANNLSIATDNVFIKPWQKATEATDLQKMHVGLMPLDKNEFNKGKLGYKIIQYFSAGLPVIASNLGLNNEVITHKKNGFLVDTLEDWRFAILELYQNKQLRESMGSLNRSTSLSQFDLKKNRQLFKQSIEQCLSTTK